MKRIGVLANLEHSMFSMGIANTSLALAELFGALGHETYLVNISKKDWWDDCAPLKDGIKVLSTKDASGLDLLVEIDRLMVPTETRRRMAAASILFLRNPFLLQELEASLYPTTQTVKREYEGLSEIWITDMAAAAEPTAIQSLELLSRLPVRTVPYLWTPSIAATQMNLAGISPWIQNTVAELRRLQGISEDIPSWKIHVTEKNTTNSSSATIPLVILREAKRRGFNLGPAKFHNTEIILQSKFFIDNVKNHCMDGISGEFVGRQRCVEWALEPMSCVLSHSRFTLARPVLFDCLWAGIPVIHNSPVLRDLGCGLENLFYSGNHIDEACTAFRKMEGDMVRMQGHLCSKGNGDDSGSPPRAIFPPVKTDPRQLHRTYRLSSTYT